MRIPRSLPAALLLVAGLCAAAPPGARAEVDVSISFFHRELAPHGRWLVAGALGSVWVPAGIRPGWAPYTDGEWTLTDYGWTWVSDDPWGGIPCHYGAWAWADPYGWVWAPGTVWAPAWVTWAYTDDYVGWAPLPPSFAFSAGGYAGAAVVVAPTRYVFVPTRQFVGVRVATVRVPTAQVAAIFPRTSKVTRFQVSGGIVRTAGPPPARIERVVGRPVARVHADVIRTPPTTLAAAGFQRASRVSVVTSEAERRREGAAAETRGGKPAADEKTAAKKAPESSRAAKPGSAPHGAPPARSASQAAPKAPKERPETHASARAPKPEAATHGAPTSSAAHASPEEPRHQARAEPHPAKAPAGEREQPQPPRPEPRSEERHAAARPQPPAAHPKPQAEPRAPKPAKEERPPSSEKPG